MEEIKTPSHIGVFLGNYLIDDIFSIDIESKETNTPAFGLYSKEWSTVIGGKSLVIGNFSINFRYPGYLTQAVLAAQSKTNTQTDIKEAKLEREYQNTFNEIMRTGSADQRIQALTLARARSKKDFSRASEALQNVLKVNPNSDVIPDIFSLQFKNYNKNNPIDIWIHYGKLDERHTAYRLEDVVFQGCAIEANAGANPSGGMSASGVGLLEIYSFIAKRKVGYLVEGI